MNPERQSFYGSTGEVGRDGILSPELQRLLDAKQHEAAQTVLHYLEQRDVDDSFPIAAMATGIGKTKVEHEVIQKWRSQNPNAKILFIAGTKLSLVHQTQAALIDYQEQVNLPTHASDFIASETLEQSTIETKDDIEEALVMERKNLLSYKVGKLNDPNADVMFATIQTIQSANKNGRFNPNAFDLVIVDEVHNIGTPARAEIIHTCKNVVGFTATPHRYSGELTAPEHYGFEIAYELPLTEAQDLKLLPPLLGMQVDTTELVDQIPVNRNGSIDYKRLEQVLKRSPDLRSFIADKIAPIIKDGEKEYKTVIAVNFVWEAHELARLIKEKGIKVGVAVNQQAARQIHSEEIPAVGTIDRYKLPREHPNAIQVLISPYVASEGFDAPFTEVLVWASPTDSDLRYTQYVGRLARRAEGKLFGLNLDFLYQTSQYGWSYNMGMWMKERIKQLPSGLLYLGPESDIAGLVDLDVVKSMRGKADLISIKDLQKDGLEDVNETDFPLTQNNLRSIFIGRYQKIKPISDEILKIIQAEHPGYLVKRKSDTHIVDVLVTPEAVDAYQKMMIAKGIELQNPDITILKKTDFPLTDDKLKFTFRGGSKKIRLISDLVLERIQAEHPGYLAKRKSKFHIVDALVTSEAVEVYKKMIVARGIELQNLDITVLKETDFLLTNDYLKFTFRGKLKKIKPISDLVLERIQAEHPGCLVKRKNKRGIVNVLVTPEAVDAYQKMMVGKGIELQNSDITSLKKTDFPLTEDNFKFTFRGRIEKIRSISDLVLKRIQTEHPGCLEKRKSKFHIVDAVVTPEAVKLYIKSMIDEGIKLKNLDLLS